MKKFLGVIAIAAMALLAGVAPANAAPAVSQTETAPGPFTDTVFLGKGVCILDKTNSNAWRVGDVANTFESGSALVTTGYRTTNCNEYGDYQTIKVYLYNANDGKCGKLDGSVKHAYPNVNYSNYYWDAAVIWINQYPASCDGTETARMHTVGFYMGALFGVSSFSDCSSNYSLMNTCFRTATGAWAFDRNNLWYKYNAR